MLFSRETNKSPHDIKAAKNDWGQLMKTVFVKEGSSTSYTNLITSTAALPLEKKKKNCLRSLLASRSRLWESIMQRHKRLTGGRSCSCRGLWVCFTDRIWKKFVSTFCGVSTYSWRSSWHICRCQIYSSSHRAAVVHLTADKTAINQ